jgi:hypothetical protein
MIANHQSLSGRVSGKTFGKGVGLGLNSPAKSVFRVICGVFQIRTAESVHRCEHGALRKLSLSESPITLAPKLGFWDRLYVINPRHRDFEDITVLRVAGAAEVPSDLAEPIDRRRVFLCHASEDKERVMRPLKEALFANGINSWIDEAEITLGDSITQKVNKGLGDAEYVIVFISPAFTRKPWPKRELDAALNREARTGRKVVIPIVIHYDDERVDYGTFLPLAEDKVYGVWDGDADALAMQIVRAIKQVEG